MVFQLLIKMSAERKESTKRRAGIKDTLGDGKDVPNITAAYLQRDLDLMNFETKVR